MNIHLSVILLKTNVNLQKKSCFFIKSITIFVYLHFNFKTNKIHFIMRKLYILFAVVMAIVLTISTSGTIMAQNIVVDDTHPYYESFEDSTFNDWSVDTLIGATLWTLSSTQAYTGTQSAHYGGWASGNEAMLISPVLDLSGISGTAKLSFFRMQNATLLSPTRLHVYYRTNIAEDWLPLADYTSAASEFTGTTLYLPGKPSWFQVAFKGVDAFNMNGAYIDDVTISNEPSCLEPLQLTVSDITNTTAKLQWNVQGSENDWIVEYGPAGFTHDAGTTLSVNNIPMANLTTLVPGTAYEAYVRANCGGTTSPWTDAVTFTTPCDAITITTSSPYTEDFTSYTASNAVGTASEMPSCWRSIYSGATDGYEPKVFNGTYTPTVSDNALAITSGVSTLFGLITLANAGTDNYVILPEFTNTLDELQILFNTAMSTDTAGVLTLGFMSDPANSASFVDIVAIPSNNYATDRLVSHILDLNAYPQCANTHGVLAFRWSDASTTATSTCCLDDLTVRIALSCAEPTDITVTNISGDGAVVDWTPGDASQNQWEVECDGIRTIVSAHPYSLSGLTPTTEYSVNVRAICGADDTSYWATPVTFMTACPTITVDDDNPYTEGFDNNDMDCWLTEVLTGGDDWEIGFSAHTGGYGITYSNSLFGDMLGTNEPTILDFLSMIGSMMNFGTGSARLVSPILDLTAVSGTVKLTFWRRQSSLMVPLDLQVYYRTSPTANWAYLDQFTTGTSSWNRESITLPNPSATYQVCFLSFVDMDNMGDIMNGMDPTQSMDLSSVIDIDEIRIGLSGDCDVPENVTVSDIAETSATITWTAGNASSWNIEYGPTGFAHGAGTTVVANNNTYTFTGLTPATAYDVYVQGNCGGDNISDWSSVATFTTNIVIGGISEYDNAVKVFPNPTSNSVNIECTLSDIQNAEAQVYDIYGKLLISNVINNEVSTLNLTSLANGIYVLRVIADGQIIANTKLVKK